MGRSVSARHTKGGTPSEKEHAGAGVIKITTIITLNILNGDVKLSGNISKRIVRVMNVLDLRRKSPKKMRAIIKNN